MFNLSFYKKKFKKILLSINEVIESFFTEVNRSKSQSSKQIPIKKKIIQLDNRIESFFVKFRNFKKYNQSKKKFSYFDQKIAISVGVIVVLFFSYFLIPLFYSDDYVKRSIKDQVSDKYDIKIQFNEQIKYGLFPKPFFYTKNLNIIHDDKILSNSGYVKFYISFKNFFLSENISTKNLVFQDTEFNFNSKNINFLLKALNSLEKENEFVFKKSKIFYKDQNDELLFLSKIKNFTFFYDDLNNFQKLKSNFEVFNIPFKLDISKNISNKNKNIKLSSKKIRLDIETSVEFEEDKINGFFDIESINKKNLFNYEIRKNSLNFLSSDKNFRGDINFKPFYFSSDLNFNYISQKKIFKSDSLLIDLLDTELLNNSNLNASINININKIDKFEYLTNFVFSIVLGDGKIFTNNFAANWNEAISILSNDIEFLNGKNEKKLVGEIIFNFDDVEKFFRYFQIKRNYRNVFSEIKADFVYDFIENRVNINNVKIDDKAYKNINSFVEKYNRNNKNLFNKVSFRNFVKNFFENYAG